MRAPLLLLCLATATLSGQSYNRLSPLPGVASESSRAQFLSKIGFEVEGPNTAPVAFIFDGQRLLVDHSQVAPKSTSLGKARVFFVPSTRALAASWRRLGLKPVILETGGSKAQSIEMQGPGGLRLIFRSRVEHERVAYPRPVDFSAQVLKALKSYPDDGTHTYHWPRSGGWRGSTKDLVYGDGGLISKGDDKGRAYCCGLTFEVFTDAYRQWAYRQGRPYRVGDRDLVAMRKLQSQWFGSAKDKSCVYTAIVGGKLGRRITKLEDARPGDFVQLWRHSGSGHSVIFLGWEKRKGKISTLRYWSTQKSTKGIGERVEHFGTKGSSLDRSRLWICRVGLD